MEQCQQLGERRMSEVGSRVGRSKLDLSHLELVVLALC